MPGRFYFWRSRAGPVQQRDDLEEDESAYLRMRLEDRERGAARSETGQPLEDLLAQRARGGER